MAFQSSPAFLDKSVMLMPGWSDLIFSRLAFSQSMYADMGLLGALGSFPFLLWAVGSGENQRESPERPQALRTEGYPETRPGLRSPPAPHQELSCIATGRVLGSHPRNPKAPPGQAAGDVPSPSPRARQARLAACPLEEAQPRLMCGMNKNPKEAEHSGLAE